MATIYTSIAEVKEGLLLTSNAFLDLAKLMRIIAGSDIHGKELREAEASLDRLDAYITRNGDQLKDAHAKLMALSEMSSEEID